VVGRLTSAGTERRDAASLPSQWVFVSGASDLHLCGAYIRGDESQNLFTILRPIA